MVDPIDAAVEGLLMAQGTIRECMQAAIEAYEAARVHCASQDVLRALTEQAQEAGLYETASTDLSDQHHPVASPQTPQTACGGMGDVAVHTVEGWMLALAERGLTADEGGE